MASVIGICFTRLKNSSVINNNIITFAFDCGTTSDIIITGTDDDKGVIVTRFGWHQTRCVTSVNEIVTVDFININTCKLITAIIDDITNGVGGPIMDAFFKTSASIYVTTAIRARIRANMIFFFVTCTGDIMLFRVTNRIKVDSIFTFTCVCGTTFVGQCWVGY